MEGCRGLGRSVVEWAGRMNVVESKFDSDVFGYRVGKVEVNDLRSPLILPKGKFQVVFVKVNEWMYPERYVEALDHRYEMELLSGEIPLYPEFSEAAISTVKPESLQYTARTSFTESRFFRDKKLVKNASKLYARWFMESERCWVPLDFENSAFLLQTLDDDGFARISLIAVHPDVRGKGVGKKLLLGFLGWAKSTRGVRVCVSAGNLKALKFYTSAGFKIISASTVYHIWT